MLQQLNRLHWDRRVMSKLYSNPADFRQNRDSSKCLEKLPKNVWRRGFVIDSFTFPIPLIDAFHNDNTNTERIECENSVVKSFSVIVEALKAFSLHSDCDLLGDPMDKVVYLVFPIPRKTFVNAVEINAKSNAISIVYRVIDIVNIIIPKDNNDCRVFYSAMQDMFENIKGKEDQKSTKPSMLKAFYDGIAVKKWRSSLILSIISYTVEKLISKALSTKTQILQLFDILASLVADKVFYDTKRLYPMTPNAANNNTNEYAEEKTSNESMTFPFSTILAALKRKGAIDTDFSFFKCDNDRADDDIVCFAFTANGNTNDNIYEGN